MTVPPALVAQKLPLAFPSLFFLAAGGMLRVRSQHSTVGVKMWPAHHLSSAEPAVQQRTWWAIAGLVLDELEARQLEWSITTGSGQAAYCATVDRLDRPSLTRHRSPRVALGWADTRGLALCIAACAALLGRDIWD